MDANNTPASWREYIQLNDDVFAAQQSSADAETWEQLAQRCVAQGRLAYAAACRRRAEHYASVAMETVPA